MPLIQITLPNDVFTAEQEQQLAQSSVESLLELEGMAQNPKAKMLSWVYLNKHPATDYFIGGQSAKKPHYRFDVSVFGGALSAEKKACLTARLTEVVLALEGTDHNLLNAARVWVMFHDIQEGNWGGAGQIYSQADLMKMMR